MNDFNKENGLQSESREVVSRFFALLEKCGVESCVVGRLIELIGKPDGDIDFVVPKDKLRDIPSFLHTFCQQLKVQVVQVLQHEQTAFYYVVAWGARYTTPRFVALEVCADYYRNCRLFLRAKEIPENRAPAFDKEEKKTGYYVPCSFSIGSTRGTASPLYDLYHYVLMPRALCGSLSFSDVRRAIRKVRTTGARLPDGKAKTQRVALQCLAYMLDLCLDHLEAKRGQDVGLARRRYGALIDRYNQWNDA